LEIPGSGAWTPYHLRHTFGTYQLETLEDEDLFRLMGHTNLATSRIYRHPDDLTLLRSALAIRDKLDASREPGEELAFRIESPSRP
jgi:integrase